MDDKLLDTISTVLLGEPVTIYDENSSCTLENELWELVQPRSSGGYQHSRVIGSANIAVAFNFVRQSIIIEQLRSNETSNSLERCIELFNAALLHLQQNKLIRKKPHRVRQSFKVIN